MYQLYDKYYFKDEEQLTLLYQFDTEDEVKASKLLENPNRTTCFVSGSKYYIGGHFDETVPSCPLVYCGTCLPADCKHNAR